MRSIDPGRSARLCSRVVAVACHCDGTCLSCVPVLPAVVIFRHSAHCPWRMAYRDKQAGQQGIVVPPGRIRAS